MDRRTIGYTMRSVCKATPNLSARRTIGADVLVLIATAIMLITKPQQRCETPLHVTTIGVLCVGCIAIKRHLAPPPRSKNKG